ELPSFSSSFSNHKFVFNSLLFQSLSQLKSLYAEGIKGWRMVFYACSLRCVIMHSNNNRDLLSLMAREDDVHHHLP
ncbi:hypothetical protein GIB67_029483, partial [Kingdonia uniflora]